MILLLINLYIANFLIIFQLIINYIHIHIHLLELQIIYGSYNDYKIEDFEEYNIDNNLTDELKFNVIGIPCIGYSGKIRPKHYKGIQYNDDESLTLGKYPVFSWASDSFSNWFAQNGTNLVISAIANALGSGLSVMQGIQGNNSTAVAGGLLSASKSAGNIIGSLVNASLLNNNTSGNANTGDIAFVNNINRFKIEHLRPKKEYLEILDRYLSRYGYKLNNVLQPNITGREKWIYLEIGDGEHSVYGNIPDFYLEIINNSLIKGITIWNNWNDIGNFNDSNNII